MIMQPYTLQPWLTPARLAATTNQTGTYNNGTLNNGVGATFIYSPGVLTIDSVVVNLNDRVVLTAQTLGNENGIYNCVQAGAVGISAILQRAGDLQCREQLSSGFYISVGAGTENAGSMIVVAEPLPQQFGIDPLIMVDASGTANSVEFPVTVGNLASFFNAQGKIQDSGIPSNRVLKSSFNNPDINSNIVRFDTVVSSAALAGAQNVVLFAGSGTKEYLILNMWINKIGTNFSGGGGDRDLLITDSSSVADYSLIPGTTIQTLANSVWGSTDFPFSTNFNVSAPTPPGAGFIIGYSGGTADYTSGSVTISGLLQRVQ